MPPLIEGIAWFSEEDYPAARDIMVDRTDLPLTYEAWLQGAETAERDLREQGRHPVRVAVVPADFVKWCAERGFRTDAAARRAFARDVLAEAGYRPDRGFTAT
jgi:hypothetical protein